MLRRALIPSLFLLLALPLSAQAGPDAVASKSCNISGEQQQLGATYVTSLSVRNTSCAKGKKVVRAYHDCRGNRRVCKRRVLGFKCRQTVLASSPVQYDARVKCKRGGKRVKHTYSQNT